MLKLMLCLSCVLLVGRIEHPDNDLPESVQQLVEQNSAVAHRIMALPYYLEVQLTATAKENEVGIYTFSVWNAPSEYLSGQTIARYARTEAGLPDLNNLLEASCTLSHIDLNTKLKRGRREPGLVLMADCDDPCVCKGMGFISYVDEISGHMHLTKLSILHFDRETYERYIALSEHFAMASEVRYKGREQLDGHWCAIIEVKFGEQTSNYWLDEARNGMVLCVDYLTQEGIYSRAKCMRVHEVFPGVFIPAEICVFIGSDTNDSSTEPKTLDNKCELVALSFSPEDWPNASEKDFGFKFRPNSIIDDRREQPKHLRVIGKDFDDVLFTFHRSEQFTRWCEERANKGTSTASPTGVNVQAESDLTKKSTAPAYLLPAISITIAVVAGAAFLYFRSLKG